MNIDYTSISDSVLTALATAGRSIAITRTPKVSDPVAGTNTDGVPVVGTLTALTLPASNGTIEAFDNRTLDGALLEGKVRFVLAAAKGASFEPLRGDVLTFDGEDWDVLGCTPVSPAGVPLVYRMGAMRK